LLLLLFPETHAPQDEGQHIQSVYLPARKRGGIFGYGYKPASYMTEKHSGVTEANRNTLFAEWSKYWDLSKPTLLEKSPPHIIMSRYLQSMFGPERSYFPIM